jgi:hypothetical protein
VGSWAAPQEWTVPREADYGIRDRPFRPGHLARRQNCFSPITATRCPRSRQNDAFILFGLDLTRAS